MSLTAATAATQQFIVGERTVYKIKYSNVSVSDFSALFKNDNQEGNAPPSALAYASESSVDGELTISVLKKNSGGAVVAYNLREARVRLRVNSHEAADHAERLFPCRQSNRKKRARLPSIARN